jgi:HAD superfamily hydrolase (TIGR01509 family)
MRLNRPALVFDFDGVLADTEPLIWKAWAQLLALHHIGLTWEEYCRHGRGATDEEMLVSLLHPAPDPSLLPFLTSQIPLREQLVRQRCSEHSPIPAGTISMLRSLGNHRIGLVTSSHRSEVEPLLHQAGILSCFHGLVFSEDCTRHKPDPEPYLLIRKLLAVESGLAFEDSDAGLASAEAAGFTVVPVDEPSRLASIVAASLDQGAPPREPGDQASNR